MRHDDLITRIQRKLLKSRHIVNCSSTYIFRGYVHLFIQLTHKLLHDRTKHVGTRLVFRTIVYMYVYTRERDNNLFCIYFMRIAQYRSMYLSLISIYVLYS